MVNRFKKFQVELRREANGENDSIDEERYGSVADNSVKDLMKNVSTIAVIRRHSVHAGKKSNDEPGKNSGYASASFNRRKD